MEPTTTLLFGHVLETLKTVPDQSVHTMVTSPPYYGLRNYQTPPQIWLGPRRKDVPLDHIHTWVSEDTGGNKGELPLQRWEREEGDVSDKVATRQNPNLENINLSAQSFTCSCGAWKGSLGLEPTLQGYIDHLVELFDEVWRVLRDDGTAWLNLGDSYNTTSTGNRGTKSGLKGADGEKYAVTLDRYTDAKKTRPVNSEFRPKDLMMVPVRTALALQEHRWTLRSDIIWAKSIAFCPTYVGTCLPESVTDRPVNSHEHIFLLTKGPRYFFDHIAIREESVQGKDKPKVGRRANQTSKYELDPLVQTGPHSTAPDRNLRSVWVIQPQPYREAHFAVFPPKLPQVCIQAGTSEYGVCASCGTPWKRVIVEGPPDLAHQQACGGDTDGEYDGDETKEYGFNLVQSPKDIKQRILAGMTRDTYTWEQVCTCPTKEVVPATVLDTFNGSGTTGAVAKSLGRSYLGCELNRGYLDLAQKRIAAPDDPGDVLGLFGD
jgi:DNA modification methylase